MTPVEVPAMRVRVSVLSADYILLIAFFVCLYRRPLDLPGANPSG
jgi:hypothetical protein